MGVKEAWSLIEQYPTHQISTCGRVRNALNGHVLMPWIHTTGYPMVRLSFRGKGLRVHRLVAQAFIPNFDDKSQVNHRDGVKTNNRVSNLEWVTQRENNIHAREVGLNLNVGENHNFAKLTYKQVREIRSLYKVGRRRQDKGTMTQKAIGKKFGVTQTVIGDIVRNKSWVSA